MEELRFKLHRAGKRFPRDYVGYLYIILFVSGLGLMGIGTKSSAPSLFKQWDMPIEAYYITVTLSIIFLVLAVIDIFSTSKPIGQIEISPTVVEIQNRFRIPVTEIQYLRFRKLFDKESKPFCKVEMSIQSDVLNEKFYFYSKDEVFEQLMELEIIPDK